MGLVTKDIDGSHLRHFDLNSQVFTVIREPCNTHISETCSVSRQHNKNRIAASHPTGRLENFGEVCFIHLLVSVLLTSSVRWECC